MSNRSRSSAKRASRAEKQSGLLESFTRGERKTAIIDEDEPTVIDLDDDDPYKFVDSQSLLPDSGDWDATKLPLTSKLTSAPTVSHKAKGSPSTGGVSTPKRSRTMGGPTGSAKRKQTPQSKKTATVEEEWPKEDMERAIAESIMEKQKEDRRQRQKTRENKAEEEQQLLLAQYQSMAAEKEWGEEADIGEGAEGEEGPSSDQPGLPSDRVSLIQQKPYDSTSEQQSSPIPVAGLVGTGSQLKSVSINKLSVKSLQAKKDNKTRDTLSEEEEVMVITLQQEEETTHVSDEAFNVGEDCTSVGSSSLVQNGAASSSTPVKEAPKGIERYCIEDEIVLDDDLDATPPISEQECEAKRGDTDGDQTVVSKPLSRAAPTAAAPSKKLPVSDKQGERGTICKIKSTKTGLSLKKSRKRLSDSGNSSFQELPHSSSVQGPVSKRPRMDESDTSGLTEPNALKSSSKATASRPELNTKAEPSTNDAIASDMEVEQALKHTLPTEPAVGTTAADMEKRKDSDSRDIDTVTKETDVKPAMISLTGIEQTQKTATKGVDFTTNQKEKTNELHEPEKLSTTSSSATKSAMATKDTATLATLPAAMKLRHKDLAKTERSATPIVSTTAADNRDKKNEEFELVRRTKAIGWPPVKIRPSEVPRHPSLQAPPGVVPAEHTKVLVQCFNAYFAKLAEAQRKVLWRIKWGKPVSNVNKVGTNSLTTGRKTRRSRAVNIPYSEYALDLKSMAPSSRSKSSSPVISSKRSTPSKSPVSTIRQQFTPISDDYDSGSDFEPSKAMTKPSSRKKLNFDAGAGKTTMTTPTTRPMRATKSRLSLGKRSPQLQERVEKSSPGFQFEREESPDILPTHVHRQTGGPEQESSKHRSDFEKPTCSVSPLPASPNTGQSPRSNTTTQFQDDNNDDVMMLDLTSPTPPPPSAGPQGQKKGAGEIDDFVTNFNFSDGEEDNVIVEKDTPSRTHVSHDDVTDDSDEEGRPHQVATSAAAVGATRSGGWLDSRKPPPPSQQQKPKPKRQPAKQTNNSKANNSNTAQSKKKTGGGEAKGRRPTKKTTSASLRVKALIQKSDSDSEHSSLEDSEGDPRSNEASKPPQKKSKAMRRRAMDSTDDSEISDMEMEEGGKPASPGLISQTNSARRGSRCEGVTRSNRDSHNLKSVIDLTADSQLPPDHTSSPSQSPTGSPNDGCVPCPMCSRRFDSSVIQLHAEQCEGADSDYDRQWSESIILYTTTAAASITKRETAAGNKKGSSLSLQKRQQRGGKSYQPSLMQLVSKEKEMNREEDDIDSSTTAEDDPLDPDVNLDDLSTTDPTVRDFADANLEWTEEEEGFTTTAAATGGGGAYEVGEAFAQQSEDGEGGYIIEPSPGSTPQPEAVGIEDGEGGYTIDPSMISDSPIRCFKRLSEMEPEERAVYEDQYKPKRGGQGRRSRGGRGRSQLPVTNEERQSATWGRDDFGDLFNTDEGSKGQGRRGRGRGSYGGRKYDWKRARSRGRGRSRARGRRS